MTFKSNRKAIRNLGIALGILLAPASSLQATTITFDQLYHNDIKVNYLPSYQEQGYVFTSSYNNYQYSFGDWGSKSANFAGSMALFNNYGSKTTALTKSDGGFFSLASLDISELYSYGIGGTVTFTGYQNGDTRVSQTISLDGVFGFQTILLNGFSDLKTFEWTSGGLTLDKMIQFDNINILDSSSEPLVAASTNVPDGGASAILLGLGILGIAYTKRLTAKA
jgi:hypothetical protein